MQIDDFMWLSNVVEELATKHGVDVDEVEEVFFNNPRYRFVESGYRSGQNVYAAAGQTDAGRYLIVFFIRRADDSALILTARDMDRRERRLYGRK